MSDDRAAASDEQSQAGRIARLQTRGVQLGCRDGDGARWPRAFEANRVAPIIESQAAFGGDLDPRSGKGGTGGRAAPGAPETGRATARRRSCGSPRHRGPSAPSRP